HIAGARSAPLEVLPALVSDLPRRGEIVAYCRGPYCVYADDAVRVLRKHGLKARRLDVGYPEWRRAGLPIEGASCCCFVLFFTTNVPVRAICSAAGRMPGSPSSTHMSISSTTMWTKPRCSARRLSQCSRHTFRPTTCPDCRPWSSAPARRLTFRSAPE